MYFEDFYNTYKGKRIGKGCQTSTYIQQVDPFCGQCVSAIVSALWKCAGKPKNKTYGNAAQWVNAPYTKVSKPKNGDIIVYPDLAYPYGHIAWYWNGEQLGQNPGTFGFTKLYSGRKIYLRPTGMQFKPKSTPQSTAKTPVKAKPWPSKGIKFPKLIKYKALVNMKVRSTPDTTVSNNIVSSMSKNTTYSFQGYYKSKGYWWLLFLRSNGSWGYVALCTANKKTYYLTQNNGTGNNSIAWSVPKLPSGFKTLTPQCNYIAKYNINKRYDPSTKKKGYGILKTGTKCYIRGYRDIGNRRWVCYLDINLDWKYLCYKEGNSTYMKKA